MRMADQPKVDGWIHGNKLPKSLVSTLQADITNETAMSFDFLTNLFSVFFIGCTFPC